MKNAPMFYSFVVKDGRYANDNVPTEITADMPATCHVVTDKYAYRVTEIIDKNTIKLKCLNINEEVFTRMVQRDGLIYWMRAKRKPGTKRAWDIEPTGYFTFGKAEDYRDPSF